MFSGHSDFKETMSRTDFQKIRANLVLRDPFNYSHSEASADPLWYSRKLMEHFQRNIAKVAVSIGTSALDEASVPTKARSTASSYIPNKPDKYDIRFYSVVGSRNTYISSLVDNRPRNKTRLSGPEEFCRLFRDMRAPYNRVLTDLFIVDKNSPFAIWILQMSHQTKLHKDPSGKRIFFTDNFYTRHVLAKELKRMTDNEARMIGIIKFTNVDATNRKFLSEAMLSMKDAERGSWCLVRAYDKVHNLEELRKKHLVTERKKKSRDRKQFDPPTELVSENARYIIWKGSKLVIFYTNDLAKTPSQPILPSTSEEAIFCVQGIAPMQRWSGSENLHRTTYYVPSIIVAYNFYMNYVDRMDQKRATNATKRREKRLYMSIFTYILDLACHQAFCLLLTIRPKEIFSFQEFKRKLCEELVKELKESRKRK